MITLFLVAALFCILVFYHRRKGDNWERTIVKSLLRWVFYILFFILSIFVLHIFRDVFGNSIKTAGAYSFTGMFFIYPVSILLGFLIWYLNYILREKFETDPLPDRWIGNLALWGMIFSVAFFILTILKSILKLLIISLS